MGTVTADTNKNHRNGEELIVKYFSRLSVDYFMRYNMVRFVVMYSQWK